jgi:hypothetical protein
MLLTGCLQAAKVQREYGFDIFGFAVDVRRDRSGASASTCWGATDQFKRLKEKYQPRIMDVLTQIEAVML